jgi:hypothetical protein
MSQREEEALETLRNLLFEREIISQQKTHEDVEKLQSILLDDEEFEDRLAPYFHRHIEFLQENFPELFNKSLGPALKKQIESSKDSIIEALFPIIGQLISRYIKAEFEKLTHRIDEGQKKLFSFAHWKLRVKAWFSGVSYQELLVMETNQATLEEIFVIENDSGMLLGHYSSNDLIDPDMIAGMLTGIKGFVEHAFLQGKQKLELLEYENYKILVQNFHSFYFANVIGGQPDADFKEQLDQNILEFTRKNKLNPKQEVNGQLRIELSEKLKEHFYGFNQVDK